VTTVIPGARNPAQAHANAAAARLIEDGALDLEVFDAAVHDVYDRLLRRSIHPHW
jgi:aryl-alcohol dehydrogenase-like predicted oxidoreductase